MVSEEVAERLLPKFSRLASERQQHIEAVAKGSIEQLRDLVHYVSAGEVRLVRTIYRVILITVFCCR